MKKFVFLLSLIQSGMLYAAEQAVTLSVPGMNCPICPITIKKSLQKLAGVKFVNVSYENKTVTVSFEDSLTDVNTLLKATENVGYASTVLKKPR
ncbi:MAG: mercury resistance system periplasmic binding protein MerP [Methylobacter sp.]|nr:mercury resistance system periplasmic binding protein MerP [Methylobacter sp.]